MYDILDPVIDAVIDVFGYVVAMRLKNFFIFLAGLFIGSMIFQYLVIRLFMTVKRDERAAKACLMRINGELISYPTSLTEYYGTLWTWLAWSAFGRKKALTIRDVRFGKFLKVLFYIIAIISITIGLSFMLHINGDIK